MLRRAAALLTAPLLLSIANAQGTVVVTAASATVTCTRFHRTGFWDVDIDNWPALPPECGPPLSFNAIRNKSKLPAQICGLVGAYIFFLVATGTLLLTWGRRLRKRAEQATGALKEIEMMNKSDYGLASPAPSHGSWFRKGLKHLSHSSSNKSPHPDYPKSPGIESVNSFDDRVIQKDREAAQQEMDRLYAAVAKHEEARRSQARISKAESRESMRSAVTTTDAISAAGPKLPPAPDARKNLRVQISELPPREIPNSPRSPRSMNSQGVPKSPYRAIYPSFPSPGAYSFTSSHQPATPMTPFSPGRVELPDDMYPASPPPKHVHMQIPPKSSGNDSSSSNKSKKLQAIKNLRIGGNSDANAEDRQPLSPTTPAGAPHGYAEPMSAKTFATNESEDYSRERLDEPRPLPASRPTLQISLPSSPKANRSPVGGTLPLRAFQNSSGDYPMSPGPVKQTILERKNDRIGRGPLTARTPRTGVPMTPYTPYMPFTPITPVTPGLMSRKMRKERIKAQGQRVLMEEDEVPDEDEMWQG
ncbi:uncharacterized protein PV09_08923 [Verruconis gallopava]|uniref:Uncharacterized protein n=1 Tax=Verruconis gallopava TaxID=253628 RepID=A0A0D2AK78_9PEZI|nr:uncharacterized protein PV09_08923 [Verruconis gallopava]KIV99378.1 hypothetical protein PV09_08923 [Verruconis gallopava]